MTKLNYQRLKVFLLTLVAFAAFALLCKTVRLGRAIDRWKAAATIRAERRHLQSYRERCEALDGVTVRLHDATAHEVYDELCLVPNP